MQYQTKFSQTCTCALCLLLLLKMFYKTYNALLENIIGTLHKKWVNSVWFFIVCAHAVFMFSSCLRSGKASQWCSAGSRGLESLGHIVFI